MRLRERTLEKWEQGPAKPNPQAAALVLLVRRYPDMVARLAGAIRFCQLAAATFPEFLKPGGG